MSHSAGRPGSSLSTDSSRGQRAWRRLAAGGCWGPGGVGTVRDCRRKAPTVKLGHQQLKTLSSREYFFEISSHLTSCSDAPGLRAHQPGSGLWEGELGPPSLDLGAESFASFPVPLLGGQCPCRPGLLLCTSLTAWVPPDSALHVY